MATKTKTIRHTTYTGTAAQWASADVILLKGEIAYETDTGRFKFGDGVKTYSQLSYASPKKLSELQNDANFVSTTGGKIAESIIPDTIARTSALTNFITKAVNDLTNYYTKSNTYSKTEIDNKLSVIPKFTISVVSSLPATGDTATIYLVKQGEENQNLYIEYIYINSKWEKLGAQTLDLSNYVTKTFLTEQLNNKVDKVTGKGLSTNDLTDALKTAYDGAVSAKHSHSNKSVLDGITSAKVTEWNNKSTVSASTGLSDTANLMRYDDDIVINGGEL